MYERPEPLLLYSSINSLTVYNLKPFTTYLCTVAAESIATGPFTEEVEVATPEDGMAAVLFVTLCLPVAVLPSAILSL